QRAERHITLERGPGGEWTMPGKWPTRKPEVEQLVALLIGLQSRFAPIAIDDPADFAAYGLDTPAVLVAVRTDGDEHRLAFGESSGKTVQEEEGPGESNRFSRPTYLRVDDRMEVLRLGPGLIAALDRPVDYYQQRRLFPSERVTKEGEAQERVERLAATSVVVRAKKTSPKKGFEPLDTGGQTPSSDGGIAYTLARAGDEWEIKEPVHDRVDP